MVGMDQPRTLLGRSVPLHVCALVLLLACSDDANTTSTTEGTASTTSTNGGPGGNGGMAAAGNNTGGSTSSVPPPPTAEADCQGHVYQCGNLADDDMDGLIDYQDPDCLGACDDTEESLYGGIPGQAGPPCAVDCY